MDPSQVEVGITKVTDRATKDKSESETEDPVEVTQVATVLRPGAAGHYLKMVKVIDAVSEKIGKRIAATNLHNSIPKPGTFEKVVHFIRHGEGYHNAFAQEYYKKNPSGIPSPYSLPGAPHDPALTECGIQEAAKAGMQLRAVLENLPSSEKVTVITSSLRRTLATTTEALNTLPTELKALLTKPQANELCREKYGVNICDMRDPVSVLKAEFPNIDFTKIEHEVDPEGYEGRSRETTVELAIRGDAFLRWLRTIETTHVIVVTHSAFLSTMLYLVLEDATERKMREGGPKTIASDADLLDTQLPSEYPHNKLGGWFSTGELRTYGLQY